MKDQNFTLDYFPEEVSLKLKNYVYPLIDPRNGETFYVGRGQGNRVFQHVAGITEGMTKEGLSEKSDKIREMKNAGLEVIHVIHRHGILQSI